MQRLVSLTVPMVLAFRMLAQCTITIPTSALPMQQDTVLSVIGQALWVCPGVTVDGSSLDPVFFLESGATMVFSGISKNIYARSGSVVDGSGIDDTIYYETGTTILISGAPVLILCSPLVFDYSQAPNGGCALPTAINESPDQRPRIRPWGNGLLLEDPAIAGRRVRLLDGSGRVVRSVLASSDRIVIDMEGCAPGIHLISIDDGSGVRTLRFAWNSAG